MLRRTIKAIGIALCYLAVWQLAAAAVGKALILPSPADTAKAFVSLAVTPKFYLSIGMTLLRVLAGFAVASCALMLVLTPSRPLWPARAALGALKQRTASPLIARAFDVYETYARRADVLAPVRALLPAEVKRFALVTHNDIETSLWRPFGAREFIHVIPGTSRGEIERRGIDVVVMNLGVVSAFTPRPGEWLASLGGTTLGEVEVRATASGAPFRWRVVRLSPPER